MRRIHLNRWDMAVAVLAVVLVPVFGVSAGVTDFSYTATPGSWVGDGVTSFNESDSYVTGWQFSATVSSDDTFVTLNASVPSSPSGPTNFQLLLKAPAGQILAPGNYPNATRYPFESSNVPGFWLSGNGRGDDNVDGYFDITQAVYSGTTVTSFAVNFQQFDEDQSNEWVLGSWQFNASVPEPAGTSLALAVGCFSFFRSRRRRKTTAE